MEEWVFRHEPQTLDDMIVTEEKRRILSNTIRNLPNTLIAGKPGTGKGTFMNILLRESNCSFLKINASSENSINDVRGKIQRFATAFDPERMKVLYLNECLSEDEEIRVPGGYVKLKDMEYERKYPVFSFNTKSFEVELDEAEKLYEKEDDIYEIELEDGRKVECNKEHEFFVENKKGKIERKKLKDLNIGDEIVSIKHTEKNEESYRWEKNRIKNIKKLSTKNVIDIGVKNNSNFILKNGILTHNCDRLSPEGQNAINQLLEDVQKITRFCFICNNENKITDPIKSRCGNHLDLNDPPAKSIALRCMKILKQENVKLVNNNDLLHLIKRCYPDIRKIIGTLEANVQDGSISNISFSTAEDLFEKVFGFMREGDIENVRKELKSNYIDYPDLFKFIYTKTIDDPDSVKKPALFILRTGEYSKMISEVAIQEINFMAYFFKLMQEEIL